MHYLESLKWRYATKKFDPNQIIDREVLDRILEAAGLTATSLGLQAIQILKVEDKSLRAALLPHCHNQRQIVEASDLLILCVDAHIDDLKIDTYIKLVAKTRNQQESDLEGFKKMISGYIKAFPGNKPMQEWLARQSYITLGTLLTACAIERVDSCPMEGFKPQGVSEVLNLDDNGLFPVLLLPIGYRSNEDKNQHLRKVRKPLTEFVTTI